MSERNLFKELMEGVDDMAGEREAYSSIKRGLVEATGVVKQDVMRTEYLGKEAYEKGLIKSMGLSKPNPPSVRIEDIKALLFVMQVQTFERVYGLNFCGYEKEDLQEKIDKLEEDGEYPECYFSLKRVAKETDIWRSKMKIVVRKHEA